MKFVSRVSNVTVNVADICAVSAVHTNLIGGLNTYHYTIYLRGGQEITVSSSVLHANVEKDRKELMKLWEKNEQVLLG